MDIFVCGLIELTRGVPGAIRRPVGTTFLIAILTELGDLLLL
jgi:hypothetical protein